MNRILVAQNVVARIVVTLCCLLAAGGLAQAQNYPTKPVRMIVAVPPGGPADTLARLVSPKLSDALGQTVLVDNRPGANGGIAYDIAARSDPDGYTFVLVAAGVAINPSLYPNVPYHPIRDFAPITLGVTVPNILIVHPSVQAKSVSELVAAIKAKQGGFAFASAGNGTSGHLALELFRLSTKTSFVHVPYKGGAPALQETIGGQTQALFSIALAATPQIKAGKVRALAITSAKRSPVAPELPTVAESGIPGFEVIGWFGWLAPAKTNKAIVGRLNQELVKALGNAEVKDRLQSMSTVPVGDKPEEFGRFIRSEYEKWGKVIKTANIKIQ
ncbi:MAG: tripartite tricarboxylate transporter substrate binding protein [Betaproteobacteria bacterium]|jgi:tripartite-type tricarboxylate transporter receptor subunit TctC|nr:tripartite tricarboxylate transporter substrate binding protein [Betaproteobacteria bacterium]MDH4293129.1 tripartite tricarboxylate transporter substrate binding protein [Betaproteobacteria bacterium]MDH5342965.1 tripartite tricarboxylate transporter substrate binding protein [Betaproteobacteria bacterium]